MGIKHPARSQSSHKPHAFQRDLGAPVLTLLTLGGIMGSGLFLASGLSIHRAGPISLLFFAVGAVAMYFEISALAEMSIAAPTPGSFLVRTEQMWGPGFTFVTGWIFWFSSVLTMSSEVTAASVFTRFWFPGVPLWGWSLLYSALIIGLNFLSVRGFGTVEGIMAAVKTLAVFLFLILAAAITWRLLPPSRPLPRQTWTAFGAHGWLPHGWLGAAPTLLLVLFAYAGTGVIGLAAAEAKHPTRSIARATRSTVLIITLLYLGSIFFLLTLLPWTQYGPQVSPFVSALQATGLPGVTSVMNLVLLFAVLSTMNAALYSNVRVLYRLARDHQAPAILARLNRRGQPSFAIWSSALLLTLTILLAYWLPKQAYAYLVTATGFQAMFIWLMVLLTQLRYRPHLERHQPDRLHYKQPGFPASTYGVMGLVILAMGFSFLARTELVGVILGIGVILLVLAVWIIFRRRMIRPRS